jgi:hypothetical protein
MVAATRETLRLSYAAAAEAHMIEHQGRHEQQQRAAEEARRQEAEARARAKEEWERAKVCGCLHVCGGWL